MFSKLRRLLGRRPAAPADDQASRLQRAVEKASEIESELPLRRCADESRRKALARKLFLKLNAIFSAPDPVTRCRDELARTMLDFARYQVLMIPAAPAPDASGLRGRPGITGALGGHLRRLAVSDPALHAALHGDSATPDDAELRARLERVYWKTRWFLEAFDAARVELGDVPPDGDWVDAYRHAACAQQEHQYRLALGLDPAFESAAAQAIANAYSIYTDIVISGARDPEREWREYCGSIGVPAEQLVREAV